MAEGVDISYRGENPEEVVKIEALRVRLRAFGRIYFTYESAKSYGIWSVCEPFMSLLFHAEFSRN